MINRAIATPPTITAATIINIFQSVPDSDSSDAEGVCDEGSSAGVGSGAAAGAGSGVAAGASSSESEAGGVEGGVSSAAGSTCGTRMAKVVK